jgi:hypothetical protein
MLKLFFPMSTSISQILQGVKKNIGSWQESGKVCVLRGFLNSGPSEAFAVLAMIVGRLQDAMPEKESRSHVGVPSLLHRHG